MRSEREEDESGDGVWDMVGICGTFQGGQE